jgi:Patatin-like phospholipase.
MSSQPTESRTFDLGLAMAGACSAGAYTAGVIDFLLEALDAWEAAKATGDPCVPDHQVVIRTAAGTSAGGVVAALLAMLPFVGRYPVTDLADVATANDAANCDRNLLFRSWVKDIDIRALLQTADLRREEGVVPSLLNGDAVERVANSAVATVREAILRPLPTPPAYFANPLQLFISFTNMQGVPYLIRMTSACGVEGHWVTSHAGCGHFAVFGAGSGRAETRPPGAFAVNQSETVGFAELDGWTPVRDAALASSAFPGGLPARPFRHRRAEHAGTQWFGLGNMPIPDNAIHIAPMMPFAVGGSSAQFWCVDGGLINNEPIEYARAAIAVPSRSEPAVDAREVDRSVILIDPFPQQEAGLRPVASSRPPDMLSSVISLLPILRAHAQFKPSEVLLALNHDVRSLCLISPYRENKGRGESDLASNGLAGFAGFLSEQFRMHDFQLGRINCQRFLRDFLFVHVDNPIVRPWVERMRGCSDALDPFRPTVSGEDGQRCTSTEHLQVIPLMPSVRTRIAPRPWPKLRRREDLLPLMPLIKARVGAIVPGTVRGLLSRLGITDRRLIGRVIRSVASDVITDKSSEAAINAIEQDLTARGLL